ncbi:MFS transporter [Propionibacteriaceae bacterium Y1923]|uniref:MFS transporter n=1 Tax=Aestuariimicrobium sp. Y1814 TaxID=3418742 RepID=UPI003C1CCC44
MTTATFDSTPAATAHRAVSRPSGRTGAREERRRRYHARGFWAVALVFATAMAFAAAPAPLYVLYQQQHGLSSLTITVVFATYAFGVAASLFTAGHLSDQFGRRRMIALAVALNVLAALVFMSWTNLAALLAARLVSGLGIGMLTAAATAYLTELNAVARPGMGSRRAEVVATVANIGGLGLGPLMTGLLAEYAPAPLFTAFMVFAFLLVVGVLLVVVSAETVTNSDPDWTYRPQRIVVPPAARGRYWAATMLVFVGFAMFGLFSSLAPAFLNTQLGNTSHAVAGLVSFVVFAAAAGFQLLTAHWTTTQQTIVGLSLLGIGLGLVVTAIVVASLTWLLIGGAVAGAGVGTTFKAALATVIQLASPGARSEAIAGLFLMCYIGMAVPVMLLGLALQVVSLVPAVIGFGVVMLALLATTATLLVRTRRR